MKSKSCWGFHMGEFLILKVFGQAGKFAFNDCKTADVNAIDYD